MNFPYLKQYPLTLFVFLSVITIHSITYGTSDEGTSSEQKTTVKTYPPKGSARSGWEKIVSFPGDVLYFPFKMLLKGVAKAIAYVDETHVVQRTHDLLESDNGLRYSEPTYEPRFGAGVHLYMKSLLNQESILTMTAMAGLYQRQWYELSLRDVHIHRVILNSASNYQFLANESFFGNGPHTDVRNESVYAHERASAELRIGYQLENKWIINGGAGYELNTILRTPREHQRQLTEHYTKDTLPGIDSQLKMRRFFVDVAQSTLNRLGNPSSGYEFKMESGFFKEIKKRQFGFWQLQADFTQYIHLFYNRTFALRLAGKMTRPIADREIPFYHLSELGDRETIRGFKRGRFHDRDMMLASAEYRYPIRQNEYEQSGYDALIFIDAGQVAPNMFDTVKINRFNIGVGGGIRVYNRDGVTMKIELSKSKEMYRFYLVLN